MRNLVLHLQEDKGMENKEQKMSVREKYHFKFCVFLSECIKDTLCIVRRVYHCGVSCGADYYITIGCKLS